MASPLISEATIKYDSEQKEYCRRNDPRCIYPQWRKKYGIYKAGGNLDEKR
jgi:hypothetical protein